MSGFNLKEVFEKFEANALSALARDPLNVDESLTRLLVTVGNLWMQSVEPVSSEVDRFLVLYLAELSWADRQLAQVPLHQLQRVRKGMRDAQVATREGQG